jgi:hypothetical protein
VYKPLLAAGFRKSVLLVTLCYLVNKALLQRNGSYTRALGAIVTKHKPMRYTTIIITLLFIVGCNDSKVKILDTFTNGNKKFTKEITNKQDTLFAEYCEYDSAGLIKYKGEYYDTLRIKTHNWYYPNGNLKFSSIYDSLGNWSGNSTEFYENGSTKIKRIRYKGTNRYEEFNESGKLILGHNDFSHNLFDYIKLETPNDYFIAKEPTRFSINFPELESSKIILYVTNGIIRNVDSTTYELTSRRSGNGILGLNYRKDNGEIVTIAVFEYFVENK